MLVIIYMYIFRNNFLIFKCNTIAQPSKIRILVSSQTTRPVHGIKENFFICFVVCNLWPVITCFIPTIMRKAALEKYNETLYKASQIVSIF